MKLLKKYCTLALCLLITMLAGCNEKEEAGEAHVLSIYASFYPIYALSEMVTNGVPDLALHTLVQPQDGCLRAYDLSDWDSALLSSADALIMGGEGLESFADALTASGALAAAQVLPGVELMDIEAENADAEIHPHWKGANPHAYMSIDGAIAIAGRIANSMSMFDPENGSLYRDNYERTQAALETTRTNIESEVVDAVGTKCVVLNEALIYTARDCGLNAALYWARESCESMDDEALERLLAIAKARDIRLALIERQAPRSLIEALEGAGLSVAALDVLSTHRADEGSQAYLDALQSNAALVRKAYENISEEDE